MPSKRPTTWKHIWYKPKCKGDARVPIPPYRIRGLKPSFIVTDPAMRTLPRHLDDDEPSSSKFDVFHFLNILDTRSAAALISGGYITLKDLPLDCFESCEEHATLNAELNDTRLSWVVPSESVSLVVIEWWLSLWCTLRRHKADCRRRQIANQTISDQNKQTCESHMKIITEARRKMMQAATEKRIETEEDESYTGAITTGTNERHIVSTLEGKKRKVEEDVNRNAKRIKVGAEDDSAYSKKGNSFSSGDDADEDIEMFDSTDPPTLLPSFDPTYGGSYEPTSPLPLDLTKCPPLCLKFNTQTCPCTGKYRKPKSPLPSIVRAPKVRYDSAEGVELRLTMRSILKYLCMNGQVLNIMFPVKFASDRDSQRCHCENDPYKDQQPRPVYGRNDDMLMKTFWVDSATPRPLPDEELERVAPGYYRDWVDFKKREAAKMNRRYYLKLAKTEGSQWPSEFTCTMDAQAIWRQRRSENLDPRQQRSHPLRQRIDECQVPIPSRKPVLKLDSAYRVTMSYTRKGDAS